MYEYVIHRRTMNSNKYMKGCPTSQSGKCILKRGYYYPLVWTRGHPRWWGSEKVHTVVGNGKWYSLFEGQCVMVSVENLKPSSFWLSISNSRYIF